MKSRTDTEEFDALQKMGLKLESPQDEFSCQPDSSGSANGYMAKVEYGIDVILDAQGRETTDDGSNATSEDPTTPIPGESEWSQKHRLPQEQEFDDSLENPADPILFAVIRDRLLQHPVLKQVKIMITVRSSTVVLRGEVQDRATKLLLKEVIGKTPGIATLTDNITLAIS